MLAENKYALVVGNSAYPGNLFLASPMNDAKAVAASLKNLNFHVTLGVDLDFDRMRSLIHDFVCALDTGRPYVSLFYYSGHGLQFHEQNFLVPVDFNEMDTIKLMSVQEIIDSISERSTLQIILLDACRSNFDAPRLLRSKGMRVITDKAIYVGNAPEPVTGLAEMRASSSTFIAFAAAPGDVAFEGQKALSPFTQALLKHIEAVDLPLSNLMSRVRQEVLQLTRGRQRTWDHSSLTAPFFFNPGSMFLFMGNALALVGLVLSFVPYSFLLISPEKSWERIIISAFLPIASLGVLMFGMQTVYSRLRGNFETESDVELTVRQHLVKSLQKGSIGGYLGSLIAALVTGFFYYQAWMRDFNDALNGVFTGQKVDWVFAPIPFGDLVVDIAVTAALTACILGFLTLFFARVSLGRRGFRISSSPSLGRTLSGTAAGGAVAGLICGPVAMSFFGVEARPLLLPEQLLPGAILGAAVVVFSIVNFDFERLSPRRLLIGTLSVIVAGLGVGLVAALLYGIVQSLGVPQYLDRLSPDSGVIQLLAGGAIYGISVGVPLGVIIGIAIELTSRWSGKPVWG
jgi:hypothetical protein